MAGALVTRSDFDALLSEIEERFTVAVPVDGVLLALPCALVVEDQPDGDGEIIERMRKIVPDSMSIGVSLDLRAREHVFAVGYLRGLERAFTTVT
ncbi:MAG: M81 family metallopeptidase [Hyphomicrobiales bacterium]|nr:M81 family metallopeptidase [Hyphomicrobiales bacterium]